jgi:phosphoglycolate phosphatase-like HAD superfamily hydrolase
MKLRAAGIDPDLFTLGAYGDEGEVRHDLPPLAIERYRRQHGRDPEALVLLGDTEHDVTSGQAAGCRVLAVCTGSHAPARLHESGAELVLEDLADVDAVLHWIMHGEQGE